MRSVQNVYLAKSALDDSTGTSVSLLVKAQNPALDARVQSEITSAIAAVQKIPEVFPKSMLDPANAAVINAAEDAIRTLLNSLKNDVIPLVAR